ncbi:MAG: 23S rRNA (uracil(1939)-C(5))-methyltransferase RlmD, partial [Candidatus Gracilibacteria bacterium]|nr:23S rRNA (uracil(1939)-C(5))-methyltransferase RlmD [Candidatus Gracilibacteria bacterium]
MKKNDIIENLKVEKLVFGGKGFTRMPDGKVIFITGSAVPGSIVNVRIIKKKSGFIEGQIIETVKKSPLEKEANCDIFGLCGGCKWQTIPYEKQLEIKDEQVKESLFHLAKYQENINIEKIEASPMVWGYRNKIEFSFGKFISDKMQIRENFNVGFHKQAEFSKIIDCSYCHLIDEKSNQVFNKIKEFAKNTGLPVYDQMRQSGFFRHLIIRKTHFTNEMMIILGYNPKYENGNFDLDSVKNFLLSLTKDFTEIKSIYLTSNANLADVALGDLELIYGNPVIVEELLGLKFEISPKSFFQTNSTGAEKLYSIVLDYADKENLKNSTVLDLYAGTGTIGMTFAPFAKEVYSVEMVTDASKDGEKNATLNKISNMKFINAKVEDFLKEFTLDGEKQADLLIIDP